MIDLLLAAAVAHATSSRHAPASHRDKSLSYLFAALSMNSVPADDDLFAACKATDFKTLALMLNPLRRRLTLTKSEFETTSDFAERQGKLEAAMNLKSGLVVCQPLDDNEDAPFTYDAERETFAGTFSAQQNVWRDIKRLGSYTSRTPMGVRATVKSSLDFEYDVSLAMPATSPACLSADYGSYKYRVPVPRADAPRVKAVGYLVFVGRLVSPFVEQDDTSGSPTLDDPRDQYERKLTVHVAPTRVAIAMPGHVEPWTCAL